ncbi:MAG: LicD family protein, partial [bacterium]|nr:LicD family protein [bacterium]
MVEEVQKESLRLMKEIDEICKKYDITYYGEGGTIIGALRHQGFIPWDDDMDIVMTRDNFTKFVQALKKENPKNRVLEYPEGNKEYPLVTIKYMNTDTASIFKSLFLDICAGGLFIDIFILDPIPRGKEKWFKKNFLSYCEILCPYYVINEESSYFRYRIDLLKEKLFGRDYVLNSYRKKLFNYKEEECDEFLIRWGITYQTVKKEYYGKPRYCKFNDMKLPVPSKSERILTNYFGDDWYILPSLVEQLQHDIIRDLDNSYKKYKDDYMKYIDKERVQKDFLKSKILRMKKLNFE